jgi:hypothetical protein
MEILLNGKWQLYYVEEKKANINRPSQLEESGYEYIDASFR